METRGETAARRAQGVFSQRPARRLARQWRVLGVISVGGGLGSVARYLIEEATPPKDGAIPWATFLINVSGCLTIGFLMVYVLEVWPPRRYIRPFLGIGVLGGYTTFSTFAVETRGLLAAGAWATGIIYVLASLLFGLAAVFLGVVAARYAARLRPRQSEGE
jgi:CrcB protein